ncbi:DUF5946 family protein [Amycolatopsis sp. FDAARGOS 1241]|uniref:DUF5946 family protein n=1 Tax=Amycolatopsis sp. FDAARGOS 1241 TaxID=2778070 RepID=UPI0019513DD0|nr:DUF5946 family protein [Amycolatopsis sp. FDAARGOS 1241]QRP50945.1 hypothetical protein I6J71_24135 [Amycolatopsis sp. FDAARGOS 1241]
MTRCPECGALAHTHSCEELFHTVLALDHSRRPPWGPLHGVTVSCFLLQHPSRLPAPRRLPCWEILHTYLGEGVFATARLTERSRRANSHRNAGSAPADTVPDVPTPSATPSPTSFSVTITDVAQDGTFPADGFPERVTAWAKATVTAWRALVIA